MTLFIKKHSFKAAKIAVITLFVLLILFNLKISTNQNSSGYIDLFGQKLNMSTPTAYAAGSGICCPEIGSICVINSEPTYDNYYRSESPCPSD